MAIDNLFRIFENRLNQIETEREKSARNFAHNYSFPIDKTKTAIKSAFSAVVLGARITKTNNPFTKNSELEKAVDKSLSDTFYKVYSESNLLANFNNRFPDGVSIAKDSSKTVPKISFIEGTYQQKRSGNKSRDRVIVTNNLLIDAVNDLINRIPKYLDKDGSSKNKTHYSAYKKNVNSAGNYDTRQVQGIGLGLHGTEDENTTVAMLAFLDGVKQASRTQKPQMGGKENTYFNEQVNKINNIFGVRKGLKVSKRTLEEYIKNPKLIDEIVVEIEYGTNIHQSEQSAFDAKILKQQMEEAKNDALSGLENIFKDRTDYLNLKGSKTLKERVIKGVPLTTLENVTQTLTQKTVKKRIRKTTAKVSKTVSKRKRTNKKRVDRKVKTIRGKAGKVNYGKKQNAIQQNPIALKELINAKLPDELLKQMQLPKLRNRTGRFRNSAQVTNVMVGPRGGTHIEYTYMKNPYQTFEPGGRQGSVNRDPRRLIGGTVREIAQELMGKRFVKVRSV